MSRAAQELPRDTRLQLFEWIAKHGPFIDDDRQAIDDDLFFFEDDEVTELGLGEAARRILTDLRAGTLSPVGSQRSRFSGNSLEVLHGFPDEPIARVPVPNYNESGHLIEVLRTLDTHPTNWRDFFEICRHRFEMLHIGPHCEETIGSFPYMPAAGRRIIELLNVLQRIRAEMNHSGRLTPQGVELRNTFFTGRRAWFSDESESRKQRPQRFTFPDPEGGNGIVCFWHGKVSVMAIRIHFEWPVERNSRRLRVVYIGPHI